MKWRNQLKREGAAENIEIYDHRKEVDPWGFSGQSIKNLEFKVEASGGEEANLSPFLSPTKMFDFTVYKHALQLLRWRNRQLHHSPDGTESRTVREIFEQIYIENIEGVELDPEDFSITFSDLGVAAHPGLNKEIVRYNSPSVRVIAGLDYFIPSVDTSAAIRNLLPHLSKLYTGLTVDNPDGLGTRIHLLDGSFTIDTIQYESKLYFQGTGKPWRGKVSDLANFLSVMEKASPSCGTSSRELRMNIHSCRGQVLTEYGYGLELLFYTTSRAHSYENPFPTGLLGMIQVKVGDDNKNSIRIYSGAEVKVQVHVIPQ